MVSAHTAHLDNPSKKCVVETRRPPSSSEIGSMSVEILLWSLIKDRKYRVINCIDSLVCLIVRRFIYCHCRSTSVLLCTYSLRIVSSVCEQLPILIFAIRLSEVSISSVLRYGTSANLGLSAPFQAHIGLVGRVSTGYLEHQRQACHRYYSCPSVDGRFPCGRRICSISHH